MATRRPKEKIRGRALRFVRSLFRNGEGTLIPLRGKE